MPRKDLLKNTKRVVVKIGSSLLTEKGQLAPSKISSLVNDLAALIKIKLEVVVVSSGAVATGIGVLGKNRKNLTIPEKQALAAVGQVALFNQYQKLFLRKKLQVGQILLTEDDIKNRRRFLNARNSIHTLLRFGVIPIINENDSVVIKEIKFGDNDYLSAQVAGLVEADLLILLSDVDGFYNDLKDEQPVEEITKITDDICQRAGGSKSDCGTGGMATKIKAAEIIMGFGHKMIIANGHQKNILSRIISGENIGTIFLSSNKPLSSKKKWISLKKTSGKLWVDKGATEALVIGKKSLLASGVTKIEGEFEMGDMVAIINSKGEKIGQGVTNFNFQELSKIKGQKTVAIKSILGYSSFIEVINRDDLIIYH